MNEKYPSVFRFITLSNLVSYLSLAFAILSLCFASQLNLHYMAACWVLCGIADCFDGVFANQFNRSQQEKQFGKEIDSLTDLFAFGAAPVVGLILLNRQQEMGGMAFLCLAGGWYVFAAVHRLAYFNITADNSNKVFHGLPTTEAALSLSFVLLFPALLKRAGLFLILFGILMLLPVKIKEPKLALFIMLILIYLGVFIAHLSLGSI